MFRLCAERRSLDGGYAVKVGVKNDLGRPVQVSWLNKDGEAKHTEVVQPGSVWGQNTNAVHPFLWQELSGQEVACVCFQVTIDDLSLSAIADTAEKQRAAASALRAELLASCGVASTAAACVRVPAVRRSGFDPEGQVCVTVLNDVGSEVDFSWVDYEGQTQSYGVVAPGATWSQSTFDQHPWVVSRTNTNEEICCCVFVRTGAFRLSDVVAAVAGSGEAALAEATGTEEAQPLARAPARRVGASRFQSCLAPLSRLCGGALHPASSSSCSSSSSASKGAKGSSARGAQQAAPANAGQGADGRAAWRSLLGRPVVCEALGKCYDAVEFSGLTFFVEQGCFARHPQLQPQLSGDAAEIGRLLPEAAFALLRANVAVWVNEDFRYPLEEKPRSDIWAHWGPGYPVSKGDIKEKGTCVEICRARRYLDDVAQQPSVLLHELAHCYHCLREGEVDSVIRAAFEKAMMSGRYDSSERWGSASSAKHYAATNEKEFFAECSEAFFSSHRFRNDYFPYVHCELRGFDPVGYEMCERVWGVRGRLCVARAELGLEWRRRYAKVSEAECARRFQILAQGRQRLPLEEFVAAVRELHPKADADSVEAAAQFADADSDNFVTFDEFTAWLTAEAGCFLAPCPSVVT